MTTIQATGSGAPPTGATSGRPGPPRLRMLRRRCPRCGDRHIWNGWVTPVDRCPSCQLDFGRHGWLAAVWVNTLVTNFVVLAWIAAGMIATRAETAWWVMTGGLTLALVVPIVFYPTAKLLIVALLLRLDPPQDQAEIRTGETES